MLKHKLPLGLFGSSRGDPDGSGLLGSRLNCTEQPRNHRLAQKESDAPEERWTDVLSTTRWTRVLRKTACQRDPL